MASPHIALVGFGRFGRALASLVEGAGGTLRAFDPYQEPPEPVRARSLAELTAGATHVVVAVPFGLLPESLSALRPHLTRDALLMDVCSVKVRPVALLETTLPPGIPWVGTHPLFGPTTLALKERPLRAVVCPNPAQPDSARRARAFYEWLGCEVLEQSPEAHDQVMAESHLAACFLAEGLLGAGISTEQPFVTPSFRAVARVMEGVKAEADHLRATVYQANPFATGARKRILVALQAIDRGLGDSPVETPSPAAQADDAKIALTHARSEVDQVDQELISLLGRRAHLAREIVSLKARLNVGVHDPSREDNMFRIRKAWASAAGLDAEAVEEIFRSIVKFSRELQHASLKQGQADKAPEKKEPQ